MIISKFVLLISNKKQKFPGFQKFYRIYLTINCSPLPEDDCRSECGCFDSTVPPETVAPETVASTVGTIPLTFAPSTIETFTITNRPTTTTKKPLICETG